MTTQRDRLAALLAETDACPYDEEFYQYWADDLLARGVRVGRYCEPTCGCGGTSKFYQCMSGDNCLMCDYDTNAALDGENDR